MSKNPMDRLVKKAILNQNLKRFKIIVGFSLIVNLGHVLYFYVNLAEPGTLNHTWQMGIMLNHALLLVIFLSMGIFSFFQLKNKPLSPRLVWFFIYLALSGIILSAVAITTIDQLVVNAITPYIVLIIFIAAVFLIPPKASIVLFLLAFVLLYFALPITQSDPDILVSMRVNALTITAMGVLLSLLFWRNTFSNYKKSMIIEDQKKQLEQNNTELESQAQKLKELNKTKDKFFSIIAHDLRSPFNAIKGFSVLMDEKIMEGDYKDITNYSRIIQKSSQQALDLLTNLMKWAMSQTGSLEFNPKTIYLSDLVKDTLELFEEEAAHKSVSISHQIADHIQVHADRDIISTILRNLISNALKFSHAGGEIHIGCETQAEYTHLFVQDAGIGMSPDMLSKLFRIDENTGRRGTAGEPPTGLGLILCKELIKRHSGKLLIESTENSGTIVTCLFPKASALPPD
jgi:two-component system, sensor histidine kinase and response regulator